MKNRIKNIFCGLGYVALFLGINLIVSIAGMTFFSVLVGTELGMSGTTPTPDEILLKVMEYVYAYNTQLTLIFQALTLLLVWVIFKCRRRKLRVESNIVPFSKNAILPIIVLAIALAFFVGTFMPIVFPEDMLAEYNELASATLGGPTVLQFVSTVLLAPILEEIIFRGLVLPRFRKAMPLALAVLLSSFAFGLMHMQIVWIAYATFLGVIMSFIALHEKSVKASILFHIAFNLVGGYLMGYIPLEGVGMLITCVVAFVVSVALIVYMLKQKKAVAA